MYTMTDEVFEGTLLAVENPPRHMNVDLVDCPQFGGYVLERKTWGWNFYNYFWRAKLLKFLLDSLGEHEKSNEEHRWAHDISNEFTARLKIRLGHYDD